MYRAYVSLLIYAAALSFIHTVNLHSMYKIINLSTKISSSSTCLQLLQLITLTNMYIAYLILIDIRSYFMMNTSLGLSISLSSGTIIIVALRLILLINLKLIRQSVKMSYDLLCTMHQNRCPSVMPCIFFSFGICIAISMVFIGIFLYNSDTESSMGGYKDYFFFGWLPSKTNRTAMVLFYILASFLECMDMVTMYTFPGMVLILCTYQFSIISELNKALARRIKDSYSMKEAIEEYLTFYAEVQLVMKISERAISPIVFFVYAYILSCLYQVTGALVTIFFNIHVIVDRLELFICVVLLLFGGVASFLSLTVHTSRINQSAILVRRNIFSLLFKNQGQNVDFDTLYVILLIADNYPHQIVVTGWGFFPLDGDFALKAIGAIITYAMIMAQISSY
ncbi:uncharacterized protein CDAR_112261 [Caerostris darwini]|uniref:Gustatory receptor n=1 Tax=Caerostris darwini TaxID=1538125 RepID=A0AAV4TKH0_9ARAC|nr:uncharacterized protein CDAR_112261 [Caerostris darwini]